MTRPKMSSINSSIFLYDVLYLDVVKEYDMEVLSDNK